MGRGDRKMDRACGAHMTRGRRAFPAWPEIRNHYRLIKRSDQMWFPEVIRTM